MVRFIAGNMRNDIYNIKITGGTTTMYGVLKRSSRKGYNKEVILCKTLDEAKDLRDDLIMHNEFYFMEQSLYGGYKIVKLQIEEVIE